MDIEGMAVCRHVGQQMTPGRVKLMAYLLFHKGEYRKECIRINTCLFLD